MKYFNAKSSPYSITHQPGTVQWLCKQEAQPRPYSRIGSNLYQGSQTINTYLENNKEKSCQESRGDGQMAMLFINFNENAVTLSGSN